MLLPSFFDLLKKNERMLRLNSLECLEALTRRYQVAFAPMAKDIQLNICQMIDEKDLQQASLSLKISTSLMTAQNNKAAHISAISPACILSGSEQLNSDCHKNLIIFIATAAKNKFIDEQAVEKLLSIVSVRTQGAAACLA